MFIQLLRTVASPTMAGHQGHVKLVTDAHGQQLIAAGAAVEITADEYERGIREPNLSHE